MDYQPAVLGGLGDHDHLLTLASGAIGLARQAGITIAYVRVAFADQDHEQVPEANKMLARGGQEPRPAPPAAVSFPSCTPRSGDIAEHGKRTEVDQGVDRSVGRRLSAPRAAVISTLLQGVSDVAHEGTLFRRGRVI
jgi:hypothetical protein